MKCKNPKKKKKNPNPNPNPYFFLFIPSPRFFGFQLKDLGTIAGENKYSYSGSLAGDLNLWGQLTDLQVNPNGSQIIFSDQNTNKIRKIDFISSSSPLPDNLIFFIEYIKYIKKIHFKLDSISTIAGSGSAGNQNGNVLIASFYYPYSIAIDWINSPDIIYVADLLNHCVRKINQTSSIVSTFAGKCLYNSPGYQDGPLLSALFTWLYSIRYYSSSSGTKLLVADFDVVRMIDIPLGLSQIKNKDKIKIANKINNRKVWLQPLPEMELKDIRMVPHLSPCFAILTIFVMTDLEISMLLMV